MRFLQLLQKQNTNNGKLIIARSGMKWLQYHSYLSLNNDVLAVTVTDREDNAEVCGFVYKVSRKNVHSSNSNTTSNTTTNMKDNHEGLTWEKIATLKTTGYPVTDRYHHAISIQENFVFTGRVDYNRNGVGMVFVHDISKQTEH